MSFRVRFFGCGICIAALVAAIAVVQDRAADANNRQPQAPETTAETTANETSTNPESNDTVYFDLAAPLKAAQQTEDAIRKALEKPITVKFVDTSLKDAVAHIGKLCGVPMGFDVVALEEEGIALDQPITFSREMPLPAEIVLVSLLEPLGLTIDIEDELLKVITEISAEERMDVRLYDLLELKRAGFTVEALAEVIEEETSGPWMNIDGTDVNENSPVVPSFRPSPCRCILPKNRRCTVSARTAESRRR